MSHQKLREDKTCLNCGNVVEDHFCPHCGQENTETRQSFGALLAHFIEDLTHYEGKFWRTLKYLVFRPAYLTKAFLEGRRVSYLPPVRLYIFVSFITFFLPHLLPDYEKPVLKYTPQQQHEVDSMMNDSNVHIELHEVYGLIYACRVKTMAELDSMRDARKGTDKDLGIITYMNVKKTIELRKYSPLELAELFDEALNRSLPKALFIYMPLFALVLWLFHSKKRWLFFDHAIFTLHYFSFMLLVISTLTLVFYVGDLCVARDWISADANQAVFTVFFVAMLGVWYYYFYCAHRKLYAESWMVSFTKSSAILLINTVFFGMVLIITLGFTLWMLH